MLDIMLEKFAARVAELERAVYRQRRALPPLRLAPAGAPPDLRAAINPSWPETPVGAAWGGYNQTAWLLGELAIPQEWAGQHVLLSVRLGNYRALGFDISIAGPEALAYLDGVPFAGIDRWHEAVLLPAQAKAGERHQLAIEAFSARVHEPHHLLQYELVVRDPAADGLAHDLRAAYDTLKALSPSGEDYALLYRAIDAVLRQVDFRGDAAPRPDSFYSSLEAAREAFQQALAGYRHGSRPRIVATGHAHIDVAWLWPLAQTRRKAARTFATVLRLMEQYPEYHFTQSQPQLYQYVKEDEPALYEQIKARIAEGRWEPTGAMWLEADTNITSGESLVRQIVYGQRFFEQEFGKRSDLLWLPDVFGYSWALPQILRAAGISRFMTSKISWSQFNRFPHDTFRWRGVDGSEVVTHFITTPTSNQRFYTYNGAMNAAEVFGTYREYRQKEVNDTLLYLFGWGDGGGGPTREMLEQARRLGRLPGMPQLEQGSAEETFRTIEAHALTTENADQTPIWDGELYLEYHRGTYTSQGRTKYAHRRAEIALREAELWSAVAYGGAVPPELGLDDAWRALLLQEFHDILPGSSIDEVYVDATRDLAAVQQRAEQVIAAATAAIGPGERQLAVFNATSWPRQDPIEVTLPADEGEAVPVSPANNPPGAGSRPATPTVQELAADDATGGRHLLISPPAGGIPALGHAVLPLGAMGRGGTPGVPDELGLRIDERVLENRFYRVELDEQGHIRSLRDKRAGGREVIAPDGRGNELIAFEDKPVSFDAWDIDIFYQEKPYPIHDLAALRVIERGPLRGGVEITRHFLDSTITQRLQLYRDLPRLDIVTEIDWHQHQTLLKAAFPVTVRANSASYEIQFGTVERPTHWNTSWDWARFEVCAQRWADLSEGDYGVALLNDGKYGYDVRGNVLRLTLLKSGIQPDPSADQGRHRFTYSLLPHPGDWRQADVIGHAAALNTPLRTRLPGRATGGAGAPSVAAGSFVTCDRPGLIVETVKPAIDGRGIILRLYEGHGTRGPATLRFARSVAQAEACTLLEERTADLPVSGETVKLQVRPYELLTLRVQFA
ncbi:MAG TPA: alpha-mannosidase [Chloroflexota bacterium]|nr:alpha-mannosidase [Chloroflexota bacterium]